MVFSSDMIVVSRKIIDVIDIFFCIFIIIVFFFFIS